MGLDAQYFILEPPLDQLAPAGGFVFLLNVDFRTMPDDAAPVTSPIVGKEGELTLTDTGNNAAISGGALVITGTVAERDPKLVDAVTRTRTAGLMTAWKAKQNDTNGFYAALTDSSNRYARHALSNVQDYFAGYRGVIGTAAQNVEHDFVFVLRTRGAYLFVDGILYRVWDVGTEVLQAMFAARNSATAITLYVMRVADAVANGYAELGQRDLDVTAALAAPAVGNTGVMTPDAVISFDVSAPTGVTTVLVRYIDANNYDQISIDAAGDLTYGEVVGGAAVNNLITAAGVISGSEKVSGVLNGGDVELLYDGTSAGTTSAATNNTTGTVLELDVEADAVTNLEARTLDGVANVGSANHPGYGLATAALAGPLAANDETARELAAYGTVEIPAIPTVGVVEYAIRYVDASNYVSLRVDTAGDFDLGHVTGGGAWSSLATAAAGIAGGETLKFVDTGSNITITEDDYAAIDHATSAHNTALLTRVIDLGTTGWLSNAINCPRDFANAPNTPGAANYKKAHDAMIA